jgi:hypothetical protein
MQYRILKDYSNIKMLLIKVLNIKKWTIGNLPAKRRILEEAERNKITYEEYIFVEKQLEEVLNNLY